MQKFQEIIDDYAIPATKVISVIRDGGSNVKKGFALLFNTSNVPGQQLVDEDETNYETEDVYDSDDDIVSEEEGDEEPMVNKLGSSSTCCSHSLHLSVLSGMKKANMMKILKTARRIVKVFRRSPLQKSKMPAYLVLDCITR